MERVITIGREFGSGGREIGMKLAQKLGIPFYDKEIVSIAAERINVDEDFVSNSDEIAPDSFAPLMYPDTAFIVYQQPMSDRLFLAQCGVIKKLAKKGPCVIVGRCADYVLQGTGSINVFIHANLQDRVKRKLSMDIGVKPENMEKHVLSVDKKRRKYYEYYTDRIWGALKNYHISLSTSETDIDGAVETLLTYISRAK